MEKEKLKIGLLYLGLHNELRKKYGINVIIRRTELISKLGRQAHLPKGLRDYVIKEMVKKGLLERINKYELKILPCKINIEEEPNKLYKFLSLIVM